MLEFNKNVSDHEAQAPSREKPPVGYYVWKILKSQVTNSKAGNPMWVMDLDIAEGKFAGYYTKYPRIYRQVSNNEVGQEICATIVQRLAESNDSTFDTKALDSNKFDESVCTGMLIGGQLYEESYNNKMSRKVKNLCSTDYALSQNAATDNPVTVTEDAPATTEEGDKPPF